MCQRKCNLILVRIWNVRERIESLELQTSKKVLVTANNNKTETWTEIWKADADDNKGNQYYFNFRLLFVKTLERDKGLLSCKAFFQRNRIKLSLICWCFSFQWKNINFVFISKLGFEKIYRESPKNSAPINVLLL